MTPAQKHDNSLELLSTERVRQLSPQLRRAAWYILENQGDIATRSQRFIADAAALPAPTFTRLARAVGLESYDQLRDICRENLLQSQTALADRAFALGNSDDSGLPLIARHASAAVNNTSRLMENIDAGEMQEACHLLSDARRVVLIGEMSSRGLVEYATYIANMSLKGWKTLGRSADSLSAELAMLGPEDACIVVSSRPYSARAIEIAEYVADCGTPIIAVTDSAFSPAAAMARHKFYAGNDSPQFFPSHASILVLLEALIDMVVREKGTEVQHYIAAVERQNHKLAEYWQDDPAKNKRRMNS